MKAVLDAYLNTSLVLRIGIALVLGLVVGLVGGPAWPNGWIHWGSCCFGC